MAEPFWKADWIVSPARRGQEQLFLDRGQDCRPQGREPRLLARQGGRGCSRRSRHPDLQPGGQGSPQLAMLRFSPILGTGEAGPSFSERYSANKPARRYRQVGRRRADRIPPGRAGCRWRGGGVGLTNAGLSATANAVQCWQSLPAVMLAGRRRDPRRPSRRWQRRAWTGASQAPQPAR